MNGYPRDHAVPTIQSHSLHSCGSIATIRGAIILSCNRFILFVDPCGKYTGLKVHIILQYTCIQGI